MKFGVHTFLNFFFTLETYFIDSVKLSANESPGMGVPSKFHVVKCLFINFFRKLHIYVYEHIFFQEKRHREHILKMHSKKQRMNMVFELL